MPASGNPTTAPIGGACDARFGRVRELFEENFRALDDVGASLAITIDGELVVDLWGGFADGDRTIPWTKDHIVNCYSATKGMVALCAHMLADRGVLDFEAPVSRYWPEFSAAGKSDLPVRYLLTHEAGLPALDQPLPAGSTLDWNLMVRALEAQTPLWEPGTAQGYHTITFGWLVGEVLRRITGRTPGQFLREEIATPLGVDFFIGFGPEEDHRVASMQRPVVRPVSAGSTSLPATRVAGTLGERSFSIAPPAPGIGVNHRRYRAAEIPAGNGHGNARALATIYGALAMGGAFGNVKLLDPASARRAAQLQVEGQDVVLERTARRTLGFMLPNRDDGDVRSEGCFGHQGMGGSVGYADPSRRMGFGYVMNQMGDPAAQSMPDPRWHRIAEAIQELVRPHR